MRRSKLISKVLTVILCTSMFTSCSNGSTDNKKRQLTLFSNKIEATDTYNGLIKEFEKENPDIEVVLTAPPDATTVLKSRFIKEDSPDIIQLSADRVYADFVDANILEDLTGKIDISGIDDIYNKMLKDLEIEKKDGIYGIPYALNASAVIYNKDIFEDLNLEIPNTWDDFIALSEKVKDNGIIPFYFTLKDSWTSLPVWNMIASTLVPSDSFTKVNNRETTFNELYKETTEKVTELVKYGHSDNFGVGYNDGNIAFAQGKSAMYLQGSYALPAILSVNPDANLGMFPLPATNNVEENRLVSGVDVYFSIPKDSKNKEDAIKFINFMLRKENAQRYIDEQRAFSTLKEVNQEDQIFDSLKEYFKKSKVVDFQDHFYPGELPASDVIQTYLLDNDKDKFLNTFQKEWEKANRQYMKN